MYKSHSTTCVLLPRLLLDSEYHNYCYNYDDKITIHGDPRPSLWKWRAPADRSLMHGEASSIAPPASAKEWVKPIRSIAKHDASCFSSHSIFVANIILAITPMYKSVRYTYADTSVCACALAIVSILWRLCFVWYMTALWLVLLRFVCATIYIRSTCTRNVHGACMRPVTYYTKCAWRKPKYK